MRFDTSRPVKILQLGAGGTGAHLAPHLYRLLYAQAGRTARYLIADGDLLEEKNLVRQNFSPAELGENKARAVAQRYATVFGMECAFIPDFIESEERLTELLQAERKYQWVNNRLKIVEELVILLGCVDNNKSRKICHRVFMEAKNLIYIDAGNGEFNGQVVCGVRINGRTVQKPVGRLYREVLRPKDKFPTELSCAEASVSAPQSIMANVMAATTALCFLYAILTGEELTVEQATFSTKTVTIRPQKPEARKQTA